MYLSSWVRLFGDPGIPAQGDPDSLVMRQRQGNYSWYSRLHSETNSHLALKPCNLGGSLVGGFRWGSEAVICLKCPDLRSHAASAGGGRKYYKVEWTSLVTLQKAASWNARSPLSFSLSLSFSLFLSLSCSSPDTSSSREEGRFVCEAYQHQARRDTGRRSTAKPGETTANRRAPVFESPSSTSTSASRPRTACFTKGTPSYTTSPAGSPKI
ncbi:hypothetical protein BJ546DRAFT_297772 [Cryomyces antarcticus]